MPQNKKNNPKVSYLDRKFIKDIQGVIEETCLLMTSNVNASLTMLYWKIGKRINEEILQRNRANYGKEIITTLSQQLSE